MDWLSGKKTVITQILGMAATLIGLNMDVPGLVEAIVTVWAGLTAIFLRLGIKKAE